MKRMKFNVTTPKEEDVNGAAWALVRLQDVYNLTIEDMVQGRVHGVHAIKGLTGDTNQLICFRSFISCIHPTLVVIKRS